MPEISFVFDRTIEDVARAETLIKKVNEHGYDYLDNSEKAEWIAGLKACRNASDLNRIGNACNIIATDLYNANMIPTQVTTKDNWNFRDIPTKNQIQTILNNISILMDAVRKYYPGMKSLPSIPINTIEKMNRIERILYEVYNITNIILTDRQVCGEDYRCYSVDQVPDLDGRLI